MLLSRYYFVVLFFQVAMKRLKQKKMKIHEFQVSDPFSIHSQRFVRVALRHPFLRAILRQILR